MKTIKTMIYAMASRWRNRVPPQDAYSGRCGHPIPFDVGT